MELVRAYSDYLFVTFVGLLVVFYSVRYYNLSEFQVYPHAVFFHPVYEVREVTYIFQDLMRELSHWCHTARFEDLECPTTMRVMCQNAFVRNYFIKIERSLDENYKNTLAYVISGGWTIYIPKVNLSLKDKNELQTTLLHELLHMVVHTKDYVYVWESEFDHLTETQKCDNSDSVAIMLMNYLKK